MEERDSIEKRQTERFKEIRRSMFMQNNNQWIFNHIQDRDIKVLQNEKNQELIEFSTSIDYNSFSFEILNQNLIPKLLESDSIKLESDNDNNNDDFSIYYLFFRATPIMRVIVLNQD